MYPPIYNSLLTLITFTSWYLTFRKMRAIMDWEKPTDVSVPNWDLLTKS
jgi:hypothetical protein